MEDTISVIIEADKNARRTLEEAEKRAESIISEAKAKRDRLEEQSEERIKAQVRERNEELKNSADREISFVISNADEKCRALDKKMSENKEKWKKEIISRILQSASE